MLDLLFGRRPADPPKYPQRRMCLIFRWIGQTFDSCDECGNPLEDHLYHPPYGGGKPIFHVKAWDRLDKRWVWEPVGSLVVPRRGHER